MAVRRMVEPDADFRVSSLHTAFGSTQNATVITKHEVSKQLIARRVKIGWVLCPVRMRDSGDR